MVRRKTYRTINDGSRILVYEDILNDQLQIISFRDYQSSDQAEGYYEYDENGLLILEKELANGEEMTRTEYFYNEDKMVVNRKLFIADELFEEIIHDYMPDGEMRKVIQNEEEVKRVVEKKVDNKSTVEFFENNELIEIHKSYYDPKTKIEITEYYDHNNQLFSISKETYNDAEDMVSSEERDSQGKILVQRAYEYDNDKVTFEKHQDYYNDKFYQVNYTYDNSENLIRREIKNLSGKMLDFYESAYDSKDRMIREKGFSSGNLNSIYGAHIYDEDFLFEHEYETI